MSTPQGHAFGRGRLAILVIVFALVVDQAIKLWVKTHMALHETIVITDWFKICFIENNGMAFGMEIGGKLLLSLFRIVAIGIISYYLWLQVRQRASRGYIVCLAMVVAGAAGNIIDSMFYGLIFSASSDAYTAFFVPFGSGYSSFLMGKVVDMFYFPIIETTWPQWMPLVGGDSFVFFSPVFNFADACITVGVAMLLLFYRQELSHLSFKAETMTGEGRA